MEKRRFQLVDVFSDNPFLGNPLAVIHDAEGLSAERMQQITRWLNLSETAFLLCPTAAGADYRIRIFALARELPFAGHPTLGGCHAWLTAGGRPRHPGVIVQECAAGLVPIRRDAARLAFAAPPLLRSGPVAEDFVRKVAAVLGIDRGDIVDAQWVDNGTGWVGVLLRDAAAVLAIEPDFGRCTGVGRLEIGLVGPYPAGSEWAFEVRALFSDDRGAMREDPVTGSLNASLAQWLLSTGRAKAPYIASQGTRLGRRGRPVISQDATGTVWVGGHVETLFDGHSTLWSGGPENTNYAGRLGPDTANQGEP
jgi:PhzF family phenazine biosynthesis protein